MTVQQKFAAILAIDAGDGSGAAGDPGAAGEIATIQCELVDPTISRFGGRIFALTPSRTLVEFAEAAPAVGCGLEIQRGLAERNAELPTERRLELKIGVDVGEVATISGDLEGAPVVVARGLARSAAGGGIAISGRVARRIERRKPGAAIARRGQLAIPGGGRLEVVELRPLTRPKAQSPWTLKRRWTWIAALSAVALLLGASIVLWRPIRQWLLPAPAETTASDRLSAGARRSPPSGAPSSGAGQGGGADLLEGRLRGERLRIEAQSISAKVRPPRRARTRPGNRPCARPSRRSRRRRGRARRSPGCSRSVPLTRPG